MLKELYRSIVATLVLVVILCGVYPFVVTELSRLFFRSNADGSLVVSPGGEVVGSRLIGQSFTKPGYFHGRPSAAGNGYDATNSSGSNLGPTNPKLAAAIAANIDAVLKDNPGLARGQVPTDLVTASGSGLDPDISPEGAFAQADRVAKARGLDVATIRCLIQAQIEGSQLGLLGEPRVNVLSLNLDLDQKRKNP